MVDRSKILRPPQLRVRDALGMPPEGAARRLLERMRVAQGGGAIPGPLSLSPTVYFRQDGITAVSGDVGAWDGEGSAGMRLEAATVGERPEVVTVGGVQGAQFVGGEWLRSTASIDLSLGAPDQDTHGLIVWTAFRMDSLATGDRIVDVDGMWLKTESGNTFEWEHGGSDMNPPDTYALGLYQITVQIGATTGTSKMWINKVEKVSQAGTNALEPADRIIAMAARATDGAAPWEGTILEWAIWSAEDYTAFDYTTLHAYGDDLIARASV